MKLVGLTRHVRRMRRGFTGEHIVTSCSVGSITNGRKAMIQLTGTVGSSGKYLVTGAPVNSKANAVLKITFANDTAGTNLGLFAGTTAEFSSGTGGSQLSDSGGPGFQFLTITDAHELSGKVIFVRRLVGSADSTFTLNIE
jgi:hypothetical protein